MHYYCRPNVGTPAAGRAVPHKRSPNRLFARRRHHCGQTRFSPQTVPDSAFPPLPVGSLTACVGRSSSSISQPRWSFLHYAYNALDRWIPADKRTSYAATQVAADIFVLNPVYATVFIVSTGYIEGKSAEDYIVPTIREDYLPLIVWLAVLGVIVSPAHIHLFKNFSLKWRMLIADVLDLIWTVVAVFSIGLAD